MGRKVLYSFSLLFLCMGLSLTVDQLFSRKNVSSQTSSNKEVAMKRDQQNNGDMKPTQNFTRPITQASNYNLSRVPWNAFSHHNPVKVSRDGVLCILFWTKRITVKFKNQTWLDLADEQFGEKAAVDVGDSNCSEGRAMLSLKFDDAKISKDLVIRFTLASDHELPSPSWFTLLRVEILSNSSVRATFNAPGIRAPSGDSYRCRRVSSLQRSDALLRPGDADDVSGQWELTLIDFQIQGFTVPEAQFAPARDCASSTSPALLLGLAMSLILLLVLAYALHMLVYLRYLDRHYEFITSPAARFPPREAQDAAEAEEKELLGSRGAESYESYELRSQQIRKLYV